ncbi:hypothetical protein KUV61_17885 [Nocardioides marinus]|nr:hypothetical protein [Nocardioides marinus]
MCDFIRYTVAVLVSDLTSRICIVRSDYPKEIFSMADIDIITFTPSAVIRSAPGNRLARKWLEENGGAATTKKAIFEGMGRVEGRRVHFALAIGLTEQEVRDLHQQKKVELPGGTAFYWSYLASDDPKKLSSQIVEGVDGLNTQELDDVLGGVGESVFMEISLRG